MGHGLKARKSKGRCAVCQQWLKDDMKPMKFHNRLYHPSCWEREFKPIRRADGKLATQKRSI